MVRKILMIGAVALAGISAAVFLFYAFSAGRPPEAGAPEDSDDSGFLLTAYPVQFEGVSNPLLRPAGESNLTDDAEVIGICVGDNCRAYALNALTPFRSHIVNDFFDGKPVSVTYCDLVDCIRILTDERDEPINLWIGGVDGEKKMVFLYEGRRYRQKSDELPLKDYPYERTTWGQWKRLHPKTLAYDR